MDDILVIVPTEREAACFAAHGLHARICGAGMAGRNADGGSAGSSPKVGHNEVRVEICGAGMAECAAATAYLLAGRRPDIAILAGIAGTYTDALSVGDTVVVASETVGDLGRREPDGGFTPLFQKTYRAGFIPEGFPAVHGNTVNTACRSLSEAAIENMEGAAFFAVCGRFGVPAAEIRTISNRVGEPVTSENLDTAARRLAADLSEIIRGL